MSEISKKLEGPLGWSCQIIKVVSHRVILRVELDAVTESQAEGQLRVEGEPGAVRHRLADLVTGHRVGGLLLLQQEAGIKPKLENWLPIWSKDLVLKYLNFRGFTKGILGGLESFL